MAENTAGTGPAAPDASVKRAGANVEDMNTEEMDPKDVQALYTVYHAEADKLAAAGLFPEAIDKYNRALKLHPNQLDCLVNRARCHMMLGDTTSSLADVNQVLVLSPQFIRAIYQKAETLYARGDFEDALVLFHRGKKARPELVGFDMGIHKSIEAIRSAVVLLDTKEIKRRLEETKKKRKSATTISPLKKGTPPKPAASNAVATSGKAPTPVKRDAAHLQQERNLLEDLQDDKIFLQDMLADKRLCSACDGEIEEIVLEGLRYIATREEFWRQGNPNAAAVAVVKKAIMGSRLNLASDEIEGLTRAGHLKYKLEPEGKGVFAMKGGMKTGPRGGMATGSPNIRNRASMARKD